MNKVAIAFLTKDRVEKTRQTIKSLLQPDKFDTFWIDGSQTEEGKKETWKHGKMQCVLDGVVGGADRAIVFALTTMLASGSETTYGKRYTHVGLCENDVLLDPDWFDPTFALFEQGRQDGLEVGAVSARSYVDRILLQRPSYAVMHHMGAGHTILTRQAAEIILNNYRSGWTAENCAVFDQLSNLHIGLYWAFRGSRHHLTVDWSWETTLARHGLASLALTPSKATMLEDIAAQGLELVKAPVEELQRDKNFATYVDLTRAIREGRFRTGYNSPVLHDSETGSHTVFPHQIPLLGGTYFGGWTSKWTQSFGPFSYRSPAADYATLEVPVYGPCQFLVGGGPDGGQVSIEDLDSGYSASPQLPPEASGQIMRLLVPTPRYRTIRLISLSPGIVFYGIETREPQPLLTGVKFDYSCLPPVGET